MRTIRYFFVLAFAFICMPKVNAQEIIFDLSLNKQDSTITYKVVNHIDAQLFVIHSYFMLEEMKGSHCYIKYKDKEGKLYYEDLSVMKKYFYMNKNDIFSTNIDISKYMKYQIVSIHGMFVYYYRPKGEFERRGFVERRTIKF